MFQHAHNGRWTGIEDKSSLFPAFHKGRRIETEAETPVHISSAVPSQALSKRDQDMEERMEKTILPKIQAQLKGLDQNPNPNSTTIELKRQLRVRGAQGLWICPCATRAFSRNEPPVPSSVLWQHAPAGGFAAAADQHARLAHPTASRIAVALIARRTTAALSEVQDSLRRVP